MRTLWIVCALAATPAFAQEIGKELPPERDDARRDEPRARTTVTTGEVPGPRKGSIGFRAAFFGSGVPALGPTRAEDPAIPSPVPTVGVRYQVTETLGLAADVGAGVGLASRFQFGLGVGVAAELYLGSAARPIRPLVIFRVGAAKPLSRASDDFTLEVDAGFGAEYWFADEFSVQGRAMIGVPLDLTDLEEFPIATFSPGIAATFHF